ncbi:MAG: thioredoxin family protein, partial [Deltaproteobacteria bacterium]|nr:thioredoxin family protein [Deltaproteobacteria bacterium]
MLLALLLATSVTVPAPIHWMENDFAGAVAKGKAQNKLVFVDAWATWCHSCLSMQRFVLVDPGMKAVADEVIWASIETETEKNRDFTEKYA